MNLLSQDPVTATWMLALLVLFMVIVAIPLLRAIVAVALYLYAHLTGRHHLRATAARVMPKVGHLLGSVVVGVASMATPAGAATNSHVSTISIDRDAGGAPTVSEHNTPVPPETTASSTLYVVRSGDSLWGIAAAQLDSPTDAEITERWKAIWKANRRVIGDAPEFIRPGMELVIDGASS